MSARSRSGSVATARLTPSPWMPALATSNGHGASRSATRSSTTRSSSPLPAGSWSEIGRARSAAGPARSGPCSRAPPRSRPGSGSRPSVWTRCCCTAQHGVELGHHVGGQPDRAAVLLQRPAERVPDPPRRVGREPDAAAMVELLGAPDEAQRAFLDEVGQRQPATPVLLRHRHDQAEVRLDQPALGGRGPRARSAWRVRPPRRPSAGRIRRSRAGASPAIGRLCPGVQDNARRI